jgi:hypothetical protein
VKHLLLVLSCFGDGFCAVAAGEGEGVAAETGGAVGAVGAGWSAVVALGLTYDGLSLCLVPLLDVLQCGCGLCRRCHDGALLPGTVLLLAGLVGLLALCRCRVCSGGMGLTKGRGHKGLRSLSLSLLRVARRIVPFWHKFLACDVLATWSPLA